jgi:hypothetical protein
MDEAVDDALDPRAPCGIAYHGVAGASADCQVALLQGGPPIARARIISAGNHHGVVLITDIGDPIAIKSGFASGYGGSGPWALSTCVQALAAHDVEIDEYVADEALLDRLDDAALSRADLDGLLTGAPVRPGRWGDYILSHHQNRVEDGTLWREFPYVMPFGVIDARIIDLALAFRTDPDGALTRGYRRLEDRVRDRTGLQESSNKLLSLAFVGKESRLTWPVRDESEAVGRGQLFTGAFLALRNPRAHRELKGGMLFEFLLLNELFVLEAQAVPREGGGKIENDGDLPDPR